MSWTNDFKNLGGQWPTEESARAVVDTLKGRIGLFVYCGTLTSVEVCSFQPKPTSDPDLEVWGVRGTFEARDGGEVELWRMRADD